MVDEPRLPTAAELGISEAAYQRILGDLRQRYTAPDHVPTAWERDLRRTTRRESTQTRPGTIIGVVVLATVAGFAALVGLLGPSHAGAPAYAFREMNGDQPVTYSSCRPIQVAVYPEGGPPDAERLVREAVAQLRGITGLDLVVTGAFGGHAPNWNFAAAPITPEDPVSVSWQDGNAIADMTGDIAGLGGSPAVDTGNGIRHYVAGTIALSRDYYAYLADRGDHAEALAVLLHEFGHVLGLAHVKSAGELMYDDNVGRTTYGPGDLEGLRRLGHGPCT